MGHFYTGTTNGHSPEAQDPSERERKRKSVATRRKTQDRNETHIERFSQWTRAAPLDFFPTKSVLYTPVGRCGSQLAALHSITAFDKEPNRFLYWQTKLSGVLTTFVKNFRFLRGVLLDDETKYVLLHRPAD